MLLNRLKSTTPLTIISFIIFAVIFWCLPILYHAISDKYLHSFLSPFSIFIIGFILLLLHSIGLNNMIYEKDVIKKNSLVLAPVFLLLATPFISQIESWIISFLLLFFLNTLFTLYQKERPFLYAFNASFLIGCIAIFYTDILLLYCLNIIAFLTFRNLSWRSLVISILGVLLPFLFYWAYTFLFEIPFKIKLPTENINSINFPNLLTLGNAELSWYIIVSFILVFSFLELLLWMNKKSIRSRKSFLLILSYIAICYFIKIDNSYFLIITPLSVVLANFFVYSKRKRLTEILFFLFVLSSIYYRISI